MMSLATQVDKILSQIEFRHPVTHEDCAQVRDAIRVSTAAPMIEVYGLPTEVIIRAQQPLPSGIIENVHRTITIKEATT